MKKKQLAVILFFGCILALNGCKGKEAKTDLSSAHTTAAAETMSSSAAVTEPESEPVTTKASEKDAEETNKSKPADTASVAASLHTYKEGNISIAYPVVSNLNDSSVENKVNKLLKSNAISVLNAYSVDTGKDTLSVECKVISADRKRITAVYTGLYSPQSAAYPTNLFYTNTVDTALAEDIELSDYADPYTLAGYVLSKDCQLYQASSELSEAFMAQRTETTLEEYTSLFSQADFPLKTASSFPEVFSYEDEGTIIVSVPVSHALGDYALIRYTPETK